MKLKTAISTVVMTTVLAAPGAFAEPTAKETVRGAASFTGGALIGGAAGGPIGAVIGAIGGAFLNEKHKNHVSTQEQLMDANSTINNLQSDIYVKESHIASLETKAAEKLEFQVMFLTGEDQLTHQAKQRIDSLARYLKNNPQLKVRLDGYADPRGTDEYNNVLSQQRAKSVATALEKLGIESHRVETYGHGADSSTAGKGDYEAYAFERRVNIEVFNETVSSYASAHEF